MSRKALFLQCLLITALLLFWEKAAIGQPGDKAFSVVFFDAGGYHSNFNIYSCSVNYPNSSLRSDSLELVWKPDLKTIKIIDTLQLKKVTNDSIGLPYPFYFQGKSCLSTNVLMVIRGNKDTMLITTGGSDPYSLLVSPDHKKHGLPFIYPFQRGLYYMQKIISDNRARSTFFFSHRDYFLAYYSSTPNIILNHSEDNISQIKMNKQNYHADDTLFITLTGRVKNDGSCGHGSILWTLQKFENGKWKIAIENCCEQMDCGIGPSIFNNTTIPLVLLKEKINKNIATYPMQREIPKGKYRFVIYDEVNQLYFTEGFNID